VRYTIDRIEGEYAVCEDGKGAVKDIALRELPGGAKPGDVLEYRDGEWTFDEDKKKETAERIKNKMDALWG